MIDDVIRSARSDFEIGRGAYHLLADACDSKGREPSNDIECDVILTWDARGVIGNGGFAFLMETDFFERDPGLTKTIQGFERIGALQCASAFRQILSAFPGGLPETPEQRVVQFRMQFSKEQEKALNKLVWGEDFFAMLADHVQRNRDRIDQVVSSPPGPR